MIKRNLLTGLLLVFVVSIYSVAQGMDSDDAWNKRWQPLSCRLDGRPSAEKIASTLMIKIPQDTAPCYMVDFFKALPQAIQDNVDVSSIELVMSLMHQNIADKEWDKILETLPACQNFMMFNFSFYRTFFADHRGFTTPSFFFERLFKAFEFCRQIRVFKLLSPDRFYPCVGPHNLLEIDEYSKLFAAIESCSKITILVVDGTLLAMMDNAILAAFSGMIKRCSERMEVIIDSPKLYALNNYDGFVRSLQMCDGIKCVNFKSCNLGSLRKEQRETIFRGISACPSIKSVNITGNGFSDDEISDIREIFQGKEVISDEFGIRLEEVVVAF